MKTKEEILNTIDFELAILENTIKGNEGDKITHIRKLIDRYKQIEYVCCPNCNKTMIPITTSEICSKCRYEL